MKTPSYMRQKLPMVLIAGLGGFFTVVDAACAQPWAITDAPNLSWKALAASADGTKMVAAANTRGGYFAGPLAPIYVSTNAGATWIQTSTPSNNWSSVASSADGVRLVAVAAPWWDRGLTNYVSEGAIYSSMDSGATWSRTSAPTNYWTSVASSADGARLVAVSAPTWDWNLNNYVGDGTIYSSLDSGATWSRTSAPTNNWTSIASSADGDKLVVGAALCWWSYGWGYGDYYGDGGIYTSSDSGATWTPTSALSNTWSSVASSVDGTKLVAVASTGGYSCGDGLIYTSSNSGVTWTQTSAPKNCWSAVASSADGTKLVTSIDSSDGSYGDGLIYASSNSGVTWTATGAPCGWWVAVASSGDGYRVVAAGGSSIGIHTPPCTMPYSGPWRLADAPPNDWRSVAVSEDGTKLVAAESSYSSYDSVGLIYISGNSGVTWTPTSAPTNYWTRVASSADGARLVAVAARIQFWNGTKDDYVGDGAIYRSLDSGATWTRTSAPSNYWSSVASSATGAKMVAVAALQQFWNGTNYDYFGDGTIHRSLDSGASWSRTSASTNYWTSVASSADGVRLVAVAAAFGVRDTNGNWNWVRDGAIYSSPDSGANWTQTSAPTNSWTSVASSADGTKLVAVADQIYTSSDSGTTWVPTSGPSNYWWSVASSADGTKLVALGGIDAGEIYISTNAGVTWTPAGPLPAANGWSAVASSADGSNIVAAGRNAICTLRSPAHVLPLPPSPQLAVAWSGASLRLSWLVPSTRFVMQQNSDLGSNNWVDVPEPPTLNFTNLHYQITLTPSSGSSFYRLKQQ